jgi:hypothetical protein
VNAALADPDTAPPDATAVALRAAADRVCDTVKTVKRIVEGDNVDPPETATDTLILDVMGTADIPPGPVRAAVRALNKLDRTLTEVTTRVHVNPSALRSK